MIRLTLDQGNSFTKLSLFHNGELKEHFILRDHELDQTLIRLIKENQPKSAIFSTVRDDGHRLGEILRRSNKVVELSFKLKLPFNIRYSTPETLGSDRLANTAGAISNFPGKNCLIVDCGTCITYTLVLNNEFVGGSISPGIDMRFEALNHFTGKLPLVENRNVWPDLTGNSTEGSIQSGVLRAIIAETDGMISQYCSQNSDLTVIITGGSLPLFEAHLKSPIFAAPFLTPEGLHEILLLNEE